MHPSRPVVVFGAIGLLALLAGAGDVACAESPRRPNVLFILTDDQPYKTLGCHPEAPDWVRTPHIDGLAKRGVRFERAYFGSWCMPSRASLLTGRLQHGVESMRLQGPYPGGTYDPQVCRFVPAEFRRQGYHTAHIGKWHTGNDSGLGRDWDHQVVWNRPKLTENAGAYYSGQVLAFDGDERPVDGYSTDIYTDLAVEYVKGAHRRESQPWFLWLCYGAVHGPTTPAQRHRGLLGDAVAPVPIDIFEPRAAKPAYLSATQAWIRTPAGHPAMAKRDQQGLGFDVDSPGLDHSAWVRRINECAMAVDEGVGRLLATLDETGQLDDTLVVFSSDQGYALGEHGLSSKLAPYDASIASPLILSWPGRLPEGVVRREPVNAPDLTATLCAIAQVEIPWDMHGADFSDLLVSADANARVRRPMLLTSTSRTFGADTRELPSGAAMYAHAGVPWWVLLRDGRHKYIRTLVPGEVEELYDLEADPEELVNLASEVRHEALLARLRSTAVEELVRTGAPFAGHLPETAMQRAAVKPRVPSGT